jgi:hypothetical protein
MALNLQVGLNGAESVVNARRVGRFRQQGPTKGK